MAAYPTLPTRDDSTAEPIEARALARATNGALKLRMLHSTEKLRFTVLHDLNAEQQTSLESHYSANKTAAFSFTYKGTAYTVLYTARPAYRRFPSGYAQATVRMEEQ